MPRKDFLYHAEFALGLELVFDLELENKLDFVDLTNFDFRFVNCAVVVAVMYDFDSVVGIEYVNEAVDVDVAAVTVETVVENEIDYVFVLGPDSGVAIDELYCKLLDHVAEYNTGVAEVVRLSKLMILD